MTTQSRELSAEERAGLAALAAQAGNLLYAFESGQRATTLTGPETLVLHEILVACESILPSLLSSASRLAAVEAERDRLKEALKPFAVDDESWDNEPDSLQIELRGVDDMMQPCVNLADIRRARALLSTTAKGVEAP